MSDNVNRIYNIKNQFGLKVVEELYVIGKTQRWLAEQCCVTKQYISQIINGKARPSPDITKKIAQIFGLDVHELRRLVLKAS
jgi:transcriptional regulator with XRE-family HTH domain